MTLWQSLCKYVYYDDDDDMIIITSAHEVYESAGTETFRIPLMFAGLQRYVYIPREGGRAGSRAELIGPVFNDVYRFNKTTYRPGGGETICPPPADGSSTVAKIAADLRPSADGSAVHTSLEAGSG